MIIYVIIQYILMAGSAILVGYLFLLGVLALLSQHKEIVQSAFNHSFLIVIHAHNEEQKIPKTLYSLAGLVYPWNLYDLLVVSENVTNNITKVSKKLGANVVEFACSDPNNIADTYKKAMDQVGYVEEKYDAIVVVRPGDLISDNLLEVMNSYLQSGSLVVQSANFQISDLNTLVMKYQRLCWVLRTFINALGRKKIGLKAVLLESGICIKTEVLMNNPIKLNRAYSEWGYSSFLQTTELDIDFAPEARVWSSHSAYYAEDMPEQSHWFVKPFKIIEKGIHHFIRHFSGGEILKNIDLFISTILDPLLLIIFVIGNGIANLGLWWLGFISARIWIGWLVLTVLALIYLSIGIVTDKKTFSAKAI